MTKLPHNIYCQKTTNIVPYNAICGNGDYKQMKISILQVCFHENCRRAFMYMRLIHKTTINYSIIKVANDLYSLILWR